MEHLRRGSVLRISPPFLVAFLSLRHIFHELHEFGHMATGRLLCGAWGSRDFNNVSPIVAQCIETDTIGLLTGMAGPSFNYCMIWIGTILIRKTKTAAGLAWGLTLIFASLPFARLFTVVIGGGDEMGIARTYIADPIVARGTAIVAVAAIIAYPLYTALRVFSGAKHGALYFLGFLVLPMLLEGAIVLFFFNYLLKLGIGDQLWFMGSPILVSMVLLFASIVFTFSARNIVLLMETKPDTALGE